MAQKRARSQIVAVGTAKAAGPVGLHGQVRHRLARLPDIERSWTPDQASMVAALRVVLDLPRQLPDRGQGGVR
jgi:hypothetical protein